MAMRRDGIGRIVREQLGLDPGEFVCRRRVGRVESCGSFDPDVLQPVDRRQLLARANGDYGLHPGRVQERVSQVVAIKLEKLP